MSKITCKFCSQEFNSPPTRQATGKGIYCSRKCYQLARATSKTILCKLCGNLILKNLRKERVFCSRRCSAEAGNLHASVEKKCKYCNKSFTSKNKRERFCSMPCQHYASQHQKNINLEQADFFWASTLQEDTYERVIDPYLGF